MLVLIAILLALVPTVAILYPFLRRSRPATSQDESSPQAELARRWDSALLGLQSMELERSIGNLSEEEYGALRHRYMTEAALVMKAMDLEDDRKRELLAAVELETEDAEASVRQDGKRPSACPPCGFPTSAGVMICSECGGSLDSKGVPADEAVDE